MASRSLVFNLFGRDVSLGRAFDQAARKARGAGRAFDQANVSTARSSAQARINLEKANFAWKDAETRATRAGVAYQKASEKFGQSSAQAQAAAERHARAQLRVREAALHAADASDRLRNVHRDLNTETQKVERSTNRVGGSLGNLSGRMVTMERAGLRSAAALGILAGASASVPLLPLVGLAGAASGALLSLGQAAGTVGLAFSGVGDAVSAMIDVQKNAALDAKTAAQQQLTSAKQVRAANERIREATLALGKARQQAADNASEAARRVDDAEQHLRDQQRAARDAQEDLTRARVEARARLADLRAEVERSALSEADAVLSLKEARQRLNETLADPKATRLERERAALSVKMAEQSLKETRIRNAQLRADEAAARKAGVEGSDAVRAARERVADANRNVADGVKDLSLAEQDARRSTRDSAQAVAEAARELANAKVEARGASEGVESLTGSAKKLNRAMAALSPAQRSFATFLFSLKPKLDALQQTAGQGLFPGVEAGMRRALAIFPQVSAAVSLTGRVLGGLAERAGRLVGSGPFRRDFARIAKTNAGFIRDMGMAGLGLTRALWDITYAAQPLTHWLGQLIRGWGESAAKATEAARANGDLGRFFRVVRVDAEKLFNVVSDLVGIVFDLGRAAFPTSTGFLGSIETAIDRLHDFTSSTQGQTQLRDYFAKLRPLFEDLVRFLSNMVAWAAGASDKLVVLAGKLAEVGKQHPALEKVAAALLGMTIVGRLTGLDRLISTLGTIALKRGPLGGVGLAIAAAGTAAGTAYLTNEDFRKSIDKLAAGFKRGLDEKDNLGKIKRTLKDIGTAGGEIRKDVQADLEKYPDGILIAWLEGDSVSGPAAAAAFGKAWQTTIERLKGILSADPFDFGGGVVGSRITSGLRAVQSVIQGVARNTPGELDKIQSAVANFRRGFNSGQTQGVTSFANNLGAFVKGLTQLPERINRVTANADQWLNSLWEGLRDGVNKAGEAVHRGLVKWFRDGVAAVKKFLGISSPSTLFAQIGRDAINGFMAGLRQKWEDAKKWAKGIPVSIRAAIGDLRGTLARKAGDGMDGMLTQLKRSWETIKGWARGIPGSFATAISGFGSALSGPITRGLGNAAAWINKFGNGIEAVARSLHVGLSIPDIVITGAPKGSGRSTHLGGTSLLAAAHGRAEGGTVPGRGRGDRTLIAADPREYVLNPVQVSQFPGGLFGLERWRRGTLRGAGTVSRMHGMRVPQGEATGGRVPGAARGGLVGDLDGLRSFFKTQLRAYSAGINTVIRVTSGFRTHAEQARLYAQKPGLAAPPGRSNHEYGLAADIMPQLGGTARGRRAGLFGLRFPMSYEPWHIEPVGASRMRGGLGGLLGSLLPDPGPLIAKVFKAVMGGMGRVGGLGGQLGGGALRTMRDAAVSRLGELFGMGGGGGGGGLSPAEAWIIQHESGGRTTADNPTSTAFGLGQLLISNRRLYAGRLGVSPGTTDYNAQLQMFRMYVRDRYGTAERAKAFWQAHGWYAKGGPVGAAMPTRSYDSGGWLPPGISIAHNGTGRPERVGGAASITVNIHGPVYGDKQALVATIRSGIREAQRRSGVPASQQIR